MIIGICGYKGSGKSTVAEYIAKTYDFQRVNFKDALVEEMRERFPDTIRAIMEEYPEVKSFFDDKPPIARALMQNYGTDVRRKDNPDYWVEKYGKKIDSLGDYNIVTDDVRFLNEADAVKLAGGVIIRVVVEGEESADAHVSETEHLAIEEDFKIEVKRGEHEKMMAAVDSTLQIMMSNND